MQIASEADTCLMLLGIWFKLTHLHKQWSLTSKFSNMTIALFKEMETSIVLVFIVK